jgi:hypothetical protein
MSANLEARSLLFIDFMRRSIAREPALSKQIAGGLEFH